MRSASLTRHHHVNIAALGFVFLLLFACTIVPDEAEKADGEKGKQLDIYFVDDSFKPDDFVDEIWDDKVVPYFMQKCLPIGEILPTWGKDQAAAGREFGYREKAEGSPWNFLVKGSGVIVAVNTASRASTVAVDLDPPDGEADLVLQIGPVIKDTGIRDSLAFISFTDFTNQLEFARLSNAFNKKVNAAVVSRLDRENLMGKQVAFHGVFTQLQDSDLVRITPVVLEVN
jgi:predicted lipoprotein